MTKAYFCHLCDFMMGLIGHRNCTKFEVDTLNHWESPLENQVVVMRQLNIILLLIRCVMFCETASYSEFYSQSRTLQSKLCLEPVALYKMTLTIWRANVTTVHQQTVRQTILLRAANHLPTNRVKCQYFNFDVCLCNLLLELSLAVSCAEKAC